MIKFINYIIMLLMAVYVMMLYGIGALTTYINPRYLTLTWSMTLVALFFSTVGLIRAFEQRIWRSGWKELTWGVPVGYIIMGIVIFLGFALPPTSLKSATFRQRELNVNSAVPSQISAADLFLGDSKALSLGDWISAFAYDPDPKRYFDQEVQVTGFAYRSERLPENTYRLSRFVLTCCVVDAQPVGLLVAESEKFNIEVDKWYRVTGRFKEIEDELIVIPTQIEEVEEPRDPYIY